MTEERFYLMNVEDTLHEYGRWCKPVLEDGETGKQYENALEVMDLLNEFNDEIKELKSFIKKLTNRNGEILLMNGYGYTKSYVEKLLNEKELEE